MASFYHEFLKNHLKSFCKIEYEKNFIDKVVLLQIDDAEREILNVLFHYFIP